MPAIPMRRWNDDRLDDLKRRVDTVEPVVEKVAVLGERMDGLARELKANTTATQHVTHQLEQAKIEPLTRSRRFWGQVMVAVAGAVAAGVFVLIGALLSGGHL